MIDVNLNILLIIVKVNGLNFLGKVQRLLDWIKKDSLCCIYFRKIKFSY